jgi:hypothetical protein
VQAEEVLMDERIRDVERMRMDVVFMALRK